MITNIDLAVLQPLVGCSRPVIAIHCWNVERNQLKTSQTEGVNWDWVSCRKHVCWGGGLLEYYSSVADSLCHASMPKDQIYTVRLLKSSLVVLDMLKDGLTCIISVLSTQLEGPVVLWTSFRCAEAFRSFSPSGVFFSVKIVTFEPLWVPQSHQSGWICCIMVYFSPIVGFKFVWSFSVHDLGHFAISASGCLILGNYEVLTLDVCWG